MNYLKLLGKSFLYMFSILILSTILITILNYFNIFGSKLVTTFKIIIPIISLFVGGFIMGKSSKEKGWLEGIKLGVITILLLFIISYLFLKQALEFRNILFYLILMASSIFGSMIGINKKGEEKPTN